MDEEGWYSDPYGLHQHRWFSNGTPAAPVRDQGSTSQDPPPETPYVEAPQLVEPGSDGDELLRADDAGGNSVDAGEATWTYFTRGSGA